VFLDSNMSLHHNPICKVGVSCHRTNQYSKGMLTSVLWPLMNAKVEFLKEHDCYYLSIIFDRIILNDSDFGFELQQIITIINVSKY